MAEPHGQCLCESDLDIKYRQGICFLQFCHEKRRMASLPVGAALQSKHRSSITPSAFDLAAASRGGYIHWALPRNGRQMLQQDGQLCGPPDS